MNTKTTVTHRVRLDFLYQSIAAYATTIVLYLIVRSLGVTGVFPTLWQDPLLLLLSVITVLSVAALVYNLLVRRQLEITPEALHFTSRLRTRTIPREKVEAVRFVRSQLARGKRGVRVVAIRCHGRRRAVRIRLGYFEDPALLLAELKTWAGPLARHERRRAWGAARTDETTDTPPTR